MKVKVEFIAQEQLLRTRAKKASIIDRVERYKATLDRLGIEKEGEVRQRLVDQALTGLAFQSVITLEETQEKALIQWMRQTPGFGDMELLSRAAEYNKAVRMVLIEIGLGLRDNVLDTDPVADIDAGIPRDQEPARPCQCNSCRGQAEEAGND